MFPAGHGMDISHGQIETDFCLCLVKTRWRT
jgi:hypothetical protein